MVRHPQHPLFYVIESDYNTLATTTSQRLLNDPSVVNGDAAVLAPEEFGHPRGLNHWASCIQIVDPVTTKAVVYRLDLSDNEAAVSVAVVPFVSQDDEYFLIVGTGKDMVMNPGRSFECGFIHVYRFQAEGKELEFIHKTKVDEPPLALLSFQGRVLAGIGRDLRIYDLGMKQLLRKSQATVSAQIIVGLQTQGNRIVVSDVQQSLTYVVYKYNENKLIPFVDDIVARWTTCSAMLDYETCVGGDKFGNLWVLRCPAKASEEADEDGSAAHLLNEKPYLSGAPNRLEMLCHLFVQDIPMSIQKTSLVAGGRDVLLWTGLQGTIGVWIPFVSKEDVSFFRDLEGHMRGEEGGMLAGRDHLSYRGAFVPVKGVIDGDLCERFMRLEMARKAAVAAELDRSVREVERKIQVSRIPPFRWGLLRDEIVLIGLMLTI